MVNSKRIGIATLSVVLLSTTALASEAKVQSNKVKTLEERVAYLEKKENNNSTKDFKFKLSPAPRIETLDGKYSFGINAYAQGDVAGFTNNKRSLNSGAMLRNARVKVNGMLDGEWFYMVDAGYSPDATKLKNAFVTYSGIKDLYLTLGYFGPNFGLESSMSGTDTTFLESSFTSGFGPDNGLGVSVSKAGTNYSATIGAFMPDKSNSSVSRQQKTYVARLTAAPVTGETNLHLGVSGAYANGMKNGNFEGMSFAPYSKIYGDMISTNPLKSGTSNDVTFAANSINVKTSKSADFELALIHKQFSTREYAVNYMRRTENVTDRNYSGYVQLAYTLTGEQRAYDASTGSLGSIKPKNPFSLKDGGMGAWEVAGRYDYVKLGLKNGVAGEVGTNSKVNYGGTMQAYGAALNWYPNSNVRLMADYMYVKTSSKTPTPMKNLNIFMFRTQFAF